jgi:hypothetical protein
MTCEEFKETAPAYALSALEVAELAACKRHLAQSGPHRGCREAADAARQVTVRLATALPARPPSPRLWPAIAARIADVPPAARGRGRRLAEIGGWIVAAAVIGFSLYSTPTDARHRVVIVSN